ncbi:hypothetical protein [Streptomyces sp. NPDC055287]
MHDIVGAHRTPGRPALTSDGAGEPRRRRSRTLMALLGVLADDAKPEEIRHAADEVRFRIGSLWGPPSVPRVSLLIASGTMRHVCEEPR